jgi:predicted ATPase/DNA-binding SARP family transcriptional activator
MQVQWTIQLFAGLRAEGEGRVVTRFPTQKTGVLLAYLAYNLHRSHPRDTLIDLLWPDLAPPSARNSLSKALSFLRRELEPPGIPAGTVFLTNHAAVQLNPAAVATDVSAFEAALQTATRSADRTAKLPPLIEAVELYRGELLPNSCESWVLEQREFLAESYFQALRELVALLGAGGEMERALVYARRGVLIDGLREEIRREVMRLHAAIGQPDAALRQYRELERRLKEELEATPSPETQALAAEIAAGHSLGRTGKRSLIPERRPDDETRGGWPSVVHNLPAAVTSFVGREQEMADLRRLLTRNRLLTLTGAAGSGKTRLSLEAAVGLLDEFRDGVFFVDLAPIRDPDLVLSAIAQTLGVREVGDQPLREILTGYLRGRQLLLLLDNFEQVIPAAPLLAQLLAAAPWLKLIVTSREPLRLRGEQEFPVPPLPVPPVGAPLAGALSASQRHPHHVSRQQYAAVELFVQRAVNVRPDFALTDENAAAVAEICVRLDGLPLAIELAAARIKLSSPETLRAQLAGAPRAGAHGRPQESPLHLLVGGARDLPERHQTLRSAIAWSYDLLDEEEKRLFRRYAGFVGGFTVEAAEAVSDADGDLGIDPLEGLASLLDKNLLRQQAFPDRHLLSDRPEAARLDASPTPRRLPAWWEGPRLTMLETIREYALERLVESGEAPAVRRRHAEYFLALAERAEPEFHGPAQGEWFERLEIEQGNLRAALAWSQGGRDNAEEALRLTGALGRFWEARGYFGEGRRWLEGALERSHGVPSPALAKAFTQAGRLAWCQNYYTTARFLAEEGLETARLSGRISDIAYALLSLGLVAQFQADYAAARSCHEESLALYRELGDLGGTASTLFLLGHLASAQNELAAARSHYKEGLAIFRQLGDKRSIAWTLSNFARLACWHGDYGVAQAHSEESMAIFREIGDKWGIAFSSVSLGDAARLQGDTATARSYYEEGLLVSRELGEKRAMALLLRGLGLLSQGQGEFGATRSLHQQSLRLFQEIRDKPGIEGCLESLAAVAVTRDQPGQAARLLGAAASLRESIGAPLPPVERAEYDRTVEVARSALGEEVFAAAWAEGQTMKLEQAIDLALEAGPTA